MTRRERERGVDGEVGEGNRGVRLGGDQSNELTDPHERAHNGARKRKHASSSEKQHNKKVKRESGSHSRTGSPTFSSSSSSGGDGKGTLATAPTNYDENTRGEGSFRARTRIYPQMESVHRSLDKSAMKVLDDMVDQRLLDVTMIKARELAQLQFASRDPNDSNGQAALLRHVKRKAMRDKLTHQDICRMLHKKAREVGKQHRQTRQPARREEEERVFPIKQNDWYETTLTQLCEDANVSRNDFTAEVLKEYRTLPETDLESMRNIFNWKVLQSRELNNRLDKAIRLSRDDDSDIDSDDDDEDDGRAPEEDTNMTALEPNSPTNQQAALEDVRATTVIRPEHDAPPPPTTETNQRPANSADMLHKTFDCEEQQRAATYSELPSQGTHDYGVIDLSEPMDIEDTNDGSEAKENLGRDVAEELVKPLNEEHSTRRQDTGNVLQQPAVHSSSKRPVLCGSNQTSFRGRPPAPPPAARPERKRKEEKYRCKREMGNTGPQRHEKEECPTLSASSETSELHTEQEGQTQKQMQQAVKGFTQTSNLHALKAHRRANQAQPTVQRGLADVVQRLKACNRLPAAGQGDLMTDQAFKLLTEGMSVQDAVFVLSTIACAVDKGQMVAICKTISVYWLYAHLKNGGNPAEVNPFHAKDET
jgi:hypothetical protein